MFSKKATFASLLAAKCQNAQFRPRRSRLQCNLEFPGRPDVNRLRWDWGRPVSSSYPELNMRTKAPAAFFSKEVTLSQHGGRCGPGAEKKGLHDFTEPPPGPRFLCPASLAQTERTCCLL